MHPYRLSDEVIVGWFKGVLPDETTACVSTSPPGQVAAMATAFDRFMSGDPSYELRELIHRVGTKGLFLDIACATGWHSLTLSDLGVRRVLGIEIRAEQVEQARLIQSLEQDRFAGVRFEHEPMSADDPGFRAGERYDVVLSMNLLYHLRDPIQHLENLRRLTGGALLLRTFTHAQERSFWRFQHANANWMSKSTFGRGFAPHFADMPNYLREAGFTRVEVITHPAIEPFRAWDNRKPSPLLDRWRSRRIRRLVDEVASVGLAPRYYTYLAA